MKVGNIDVCRAPLPGAAGRRLLRAVVRPLHEKISWPARKPSRDECGFLSGLLLEGLLPGENGLLDSARSDFEDFQKTHGLAPGGAGVICRLRLESAMAREEHEIRVSAHEVSVRAGDIEGVRRAIYWIEDEMLKRGGPFLPFGVHRRRAVIQARISRCFFGPINRPPANRDELLDEVDYYPSEYLNRLAHDGVNVLWITIRLSDTVPSPLFPNGAPYAARRLSKLRDTVERCARYGISIYVFCIEPDSLPLDSPVFVQHPELKGHVIDFRAAFCTSTKTGRRYLTDSCKTLFESVPGLGGMIVIPVGERFTHCYSIALPDSGTTEERCNCPRCSRRKPTEVLRDTLSSMHRGMVAANPRAEFIAWPYGQLIMWGEKMTVDSAGCLPPAVILQHNFETGGSILQLGKKRLLWDYWLSVVGASPAFRKTAKTARANGNRVSAKLQVGCSHEDATVPFVPVPGLLYDKYALLHRLGVSAVMQSWYFGNCPSLMTRAAGSLSFAPLPENESAFLADLASRDWGRLSPKVVRAWQFFRRAYENYPATHFFGYYGPVQDGLVWPLYLVPRNRPLAPTWRLDYPPSGDYLADCLSADFSLAEMVTLCTRMSRLWQRGLGHLAAAMAGAEGTSSQITEWRVAQAIGYQFESAAEILRFYQLREALINSCGHRAAITLDRMENLVRREIHRRRMMLDLCCLDPMIGFHSEAEGFKITPALLRKGQRSLERLLVGEFARVRRDIDAGEPLFPHYTGRGAQNVLHFNHRESAFIPLRHVLVQRRVDPRGRLITGTEWRRCVAKGCPWSVMFQAGRSARSLRLVIRIAGKDGSSLKEPWRFSILADIEPRRLHPRLQFSGDSCGFKVALVDDGYLTKKPPAFGWQWRERSTGCLAKMDIPLKAARMGRARSLFRFNLRLTAFNPETNQRWEVSWKRRSPLKPRQGWEDANPASDYGWARLDPV